MSYLISLDCLDIFSELSSLWHKEIVILLLEKIGCCAQMKRTQACQNNACVSFTVMEDVMLQSVHYYKIKITGILTSVRQHVICIESRILLKHS